MIIRPLEKGDERSCVEVVSSLPEWFSYPGALESVASAVSTQEGFVAVDEGDVVAFVTTKPAFDETIEITYLAVHRDHRRSGFGRSLVRSVVRFGVVEGYQSVCLLTLGPSSESPYYAETVAFYRSIGLWQIKELRLSEWGGAPALLMGAPLTKLGHELSN
jgi:ribosomal protein S18 acetylase RimI-like enzyme